MVFRNCPTLAFIVDTKENLFAQTDAALAIRNMELYALTQQLGSCWCGFIMMAQNVAPEIITELGFDKEKYSIAGALMIGKPTVDFTRKVPRRKRKIIFKE
eukprot:EC825819.1.p1 GENE.EC825819.1~~EC825819.1.p1  ORF type:complete len:101 (+),score=51.43 EC825819.1:351-653(+)